jgi:protein SCO1/2
MARIRQCRPFFFVRSALLLLLLAALGAGCAGAPAPSAQGGVPGQSAADFTLTNQDGRQVALHDLRGKTVVMDFIYTNCPPGDACPILTAKMATLQRSLENGRLSDRVVLLSVTIDPERDTPEVLKEYAQRFGAELANWHFLRGDQSQTHQVTNAYGIAHIHDASGAIGHSAVLLVVDPKGTIRARETQMVTNDDLLARVLDAAN